MAPAHSFPLRAECALKEGKEAFKAMSSWGSLRRLDLAPKVGIRKPGGGLRKEREITEKPVQRKILYVHISVEKA